MNSDRDKTSILDVLAMMLLIVFFAGISTFSLVNGGLMPGLLFGALALLVTWLLIRDLRWGVRAPNRWEWFKAWMNVQPVIIGGVGMALLAAVVTYGPPKLTEEMKIGLTGGILVWVIVLAITIWRSQRPRFEGDAAYKKRMGWQDSKEYI